MLVDLFLLEFIYILNHLKIELQLKILIIFAKTLVGSEKDRKMNNSYMQGT